MTPENCAFVTSLLTSFRASSTTCLRIGLGASRAASRRVIVVGIERCQIAEASIPGPSPKAPPTGLTLGAHFHPSPTAATRSGDEDEPRDPFERRQSA